MPCQENKECSCSCCADEYRNKILDLIKHYEEKIDLIDTMLEQLNFTETQKEAATVTYAVFCKFISQLNSILSADSEELKNE